MEDETPTPEDQPNIDPTQDSNPEKNGKNKTIHLDDKDANKTLGLKKGFSWTYRKTKPDGSKKEHKFKTRTGLRFNLSIKDVRDS